MENEAWESVQNVRAVIVGGVITRISQSKVQIVCKVGFLGNPARAALWYIACFTKSHVPSPNKCVVVVFVRVLYICHLCRCCSFRAVI